MKKQIKDILWLTLSAFLPALAVNLFFIPTRLAPGGLTGLALVISTVTGISMDIMTLCISIPLLGLSVILIGKAFGAKTLYITLATPLFLNLVPRIDVTTNLLVAAIIGGLIIGCSVGIAICRNCATGGSDLIAFIINHFLKFIEVRHLILAVDSAVIIGAGIITQDIYVALFSFFSLLIIIQTIKFITTKCKFISAE